MKRISTIVLSAVVAATLAGCGGSSDASSSSSTSSTPTATAAIHADGRYATIGELRAAVVEAGIQCPDSIWVPEPASSIDQAAGEGKCGDTLTLVATTPEGVPAANAAMSHRILDAWFKNDKTKWQIVEGPAWVALGTPAVAAILVAKMGGREVQGSA